MLSCPTPLSLQDYGWILRRFRDHLRMKLTCAHGLFAATLLVVCCAVFTSSGQPARPARGVASAASKRPRLVVLIVVDQFRYDYLTRFGDLFTSRGIGRLMREGASWADANFDHVPTYTAPGHATFMTGAWPSETGIIGNEWFDKDIEKKVASVTDDATMMLGGTPDQKGKSPRRLLCSTIGDELRLADNDRSKVIGISAKDRSAILPAGRHANAAYWFNTENGNMVSSTYYFNEMPQWVASFNTSRLADKWFGARWHRLLPSENEYLKRAGKDVVPWEDFDKSSNDTNSFPHVVTGGANSASKAFYRALDSTPFSNELLVTFAKEAITNEQLGADDDPDLLSVSFSANDYVGHRFGPYSQEAMDITLRVDRQIASLLDFIDARVGLANTIVVFTADHGVSPVPEHAGLMNLPAHRHSKEQLLKIVQEGLQARYARQGRPADDYIRTFSQESGLINNNFYLNRAALLRDGIDPDECERVVGEAAMRMPGVARYFTRAQLEKSPPAISDPVARRVHHGFNSQRSGDVIVLFEPYNILFSLPDEPTESRQTTTHGSGYSYDTHVPLIIMGRDFSAGNYAQAATPADIAASLAKALNIESPSCSVGRILFEGLVQTNGRRSRPAR
jgi:predicted AlkP superfamily pyrophosphatase or phosphodiesterase